MTILSQQQLLHQHHVMTTHQYGLVRGQQLGNDATGRASIYGHIGAALQSASNTPATGFHDLSWTLARTAPASPPHAEAAELRCFHALLESCCNIWGCRVETLD